MFGLTYSQEHCSLADYSPTSQSNLQRVHDILSVISYNLVLRLSIASFSPFVVEM